MLRLRLPMLALMFAIGGCQFLRMNPGRVEAITLGAQVGEFRHAQGRWPGTVQDLDGSTLLADFPDADLGEGTNKPVAVPRRVEMRSSGENLIVELYDASKRRICRLRVLAPVPGNSDALIPVVVVKTSVFSCPGEGKSIQ